MWDSETKWISVNLGPIIVDLITTNETENKLDGPFGTELANSCWQSQHLFILSLSGIPLCILGHTLNANLHVFHRATQIFYQTRLRKTVIICHLSLFYK